MRLLLFFSCILLGQFAGAQTCTALGQNPSTAFPVCGTSVFAQSSVPICGGREMPFKGCPGSGLSDVNPYWYKFTCFQSGSLGFLITPNDMSSDYDWELYDVTGKSPDAVYTDGNLVVGNNWSGEKGLTGASNAGTMKFVCGGLGKPKFSLMPQLVQGRNYLLLISHFTQTQSGYKLSFGGGTAVITDPADPRLKKAEANCGGDKIRVALSKKMRCNTVTGTGSEFYIPGGLNIISATAFGCNTGFDTDSLELTLSGFLPPGNYALRIRKGSDNNTILDNCDRPVPETDSLPFILLPKAPTPMDSLATLTCAPNQLRLVFRKPMLCSSIAANGSDFSINGTYPVSVTTAGGTCVNGLTKEVIVTMPAPLQRAGAFNIVLQTGSDGNTLLDECSEETPAGSTLPFVVLDTVNAAFTHTISYGCLRDTVDYMHPGGNGVNSWQWDLDEGLQGSGQNITAHYSVFNEKNVRLVVSNGFCRDTAVQKVALINFLKADFFVFEDNCPQELIPFTNKSQGVALKYQWTFGDGARADSLHPKHSYGIPQRETPYIVRLVITDSFGCKASVEKKIIIYSSCFIAVPNAFTPNNDGLNDRFHVLNAVKSLDFQFRVYNRWGQEMFTGNHWKQSWDGRYNGILQPSGVYVWFVRFRNRDTNKMVEQKGTVTLIR